MNAPFPSRPANDDEPNHKRLFWAAIATLACYVTLASIALLGFAQDGSFWFFKMLTQESFYIYNPARAFGLMVKEALPFAAIRLHCTDLRTLVYLWSFSFAFWNVIHVILSLLLCRWRRSLFLTAATIFCFTSQYILAGFACCYENLWAGCIFWFLFLHFLSDDRPRTAWYDTSVTLTLLLFLSVYEGVCVFALFLLAMNALHWRAAGWARPSLRSCFANAILVAACAFNVFVALQPGRAADKASFLATLYALPRPAFTMVLVFFGFVLSLLLFRAIPRLTNRPCPEGLYATCWRVVQGIAVTTMLYLTAVNGTQIAADMYFCRGLNLLIPLCMAIFVSISLTLRIDYRSEDYIPFAWGMLVAMLLFYADACRTYREYQFAISDRDGTRSGFINVTMQSEVAAGLPYNDTWCIPFMSVVSSVVHGDDLITAITVIDRPGWLRVTSLRSMPDLTRYGIRYDAGRFQKVAAATE